MKEVRPTNCHYCGYCCALLATVEDGRVTEVRSDPARFPYSEQIMAGCPRWKMNLDELDAPDRVNYPLRRVGERGSGEWERVSWDDALDDIAQRLSALADEYGPETLASCIGGPHASFWPLHRFMNGFGSPNNMGIGQICWNPRIWMDCITFGWTLEADIRQGYTECLFIWGTNPAQSDNSLFWRSLIDYAKTDAKLVVIDPRRTQVAKRADVWLPLIPGTDCTLALGFLHVFIEEDYVDRDFVGTWCHGFNELKAHVASYTPEYVCKVCGLNQDDFLTAARYFGQAASAALVSGRGVDQIGVDVSPTHRALCCMRAITGNVDKPGACVLTEAPDFVSEVEAEMTSVLGEEHRARCLNTGVTPLQCFDGYERMCELTGKLGRYLPARYMTSAHPDLVLRAMETGKPYPVRALIVNATNPLLTYGDTPRVYRALSNLELLVVLDYRITSTAALADYVLPVAGAIERPIMQVHGGVSNNAYGGPAAVSPYYERKTDYDVYRLLGLRLGQQDLWPEETLEDAFAAQLQRAHVTWEDFCVTGAYGPMPRFFKHKITNDQGICQGFATTTGKIELASEFLPPFGGQRLPVPSHRVSTCEESVAPAEAGATRVAEIPDCTAEHLSLITGARKQPYNASMYMNHPAFRERSPRPVADMSAATAEALGLAAGDVIRVSNQKGSAIYELAISEMRDFVVSVDYGWWHPEEIPKAPDFGGVWESNANCLTSVFVGEPLIGTWAYNALNCQVEKYDGPWSFA